MYERLFTLGKVKGYFLLSSGRGRLPRAAFEAPAWQFQIPLKIRHFTVEALFRRDAPSPRAGLALPVARKKHEIESEGPCLHFLEKLKVGQGGGHFEVKATAFWTFPGVALHLTLRSSTQSDEKSRVQPTL